MLVLGRKFIGGPERYGVARGYLFLFPGPNSYVVCLSNSQWYRCTEIFHWLLVGYSKEFLINQCVLTCQLNFKVNDDYCMKCSSTFSDSLK